ncbi:putative ABC transporter ATP-binding protein YxlF [Clostridiales bacterium]|nr:putative ABC transporter ATP-binding protein YxlF [Clostridiales bacterium]
MELTTINLAKQYGKKTAVDHLDISFSNGVYGLLGANGAGKTTLMRLLCAILKPTSGKITLNGKNISYLGEKYRNLLGYLPQSCIYYSGFTAQEFLLYISALKGLSLSNAKKNTIELLSAVGLENETNKKIKTFSGGMKKRLGIAQAVLNNPKILILDEPTAGLDPKERVRFRNLISAFSRDRIVILSTHIVSDVEFIAEKILMIKSGQLLHCGSAEDISCELNGRVWECLIPSIEADNYVSHCNVSNLKNVENGKTILRVISERQPLKNAVQVRPNLEDLYLYYFKEEN